MRSKAAAVLLIALASPLAGCAYNSATEQEAAACRVLGPKALVGALGGAAGGAAIGAAAGGNGQAALIGAGIGLLAGLVAGHVADNQDCQAAQTALTANLEAARTGQTIGWSSKSGHQGAYRVTSDPFAAHESQLCRQAMSVPAPGSSEVPKPLVACRQPDGDWSYYNS